MYALVSQIVNPSFCYIFIHLLFPFFSFSSFPPFFPFVAILSCPAVLDCCQQTGAAAGVPGLESVKSYCFW